MRITAVSYLNTIPFIYGIQSSGLLTDVDLDLQVPSMCAAQMRDGIADIALVPVGALTGLGDVDIVSDFCLGADGAVDTVLYIGDVPPEEAGRVHLDMDSMTSVRLARLLFREHWGGQPRFSEGLNSYDPLTQSSDAAIVIGDKARAYARGRKVVIDLARAWKKMTGLPFVFAVWTARKGMDPSILKDFNAALQWGIDHLGESILNYHTGSFAKAFEYLTRRIRFEFGPEQRKAVSFFLERLGETGL